MATRQYIGARYVPRFDGEHTTTKSYEPLTIVTDANMSSSYTSKKFVPIGVELNNSEYWALTGSISGAILDLQNRVTENENDIADLLPRVTENENDIELLENKATQTETDITALKSFAGSFDYYNGNNNSENFEISAGTPKTVNSVSIPAHSLALITACCQVKNASAVDGTLYKFGMYLGTPVDVVNYARSTSLANNLEGSRLKSGIANNYLNYVYANNGDTAITFNLNVVMNDIDATVYPFLRIMVFPLGLV